MSFEIFWYIPNHVIYARLWGTVTAEDGDEINRLLVQHLDDSLEESVYTIFDDTLLENSPFSLNQLKEFRNSVSHPRCCWTIILNESNPLMNVMPSMMMQFLGARYRRVKTFDEALAFVLDQNAAIASLLSETILAS